MSLVLFLFVAGVGLSAADTPPSLPHESAERSLRVTLGGVSVTEVRDRGPDGGLVSSGFAIALRDVLVIARDSFRVTGGDADELLMDERGARVSRMQAPTVSFLRLNNVGEREVLQPGGELEVEPVGEMIRSVYCTEEKVSITWTFTSRAQVPLDLEVALELGPAFGPSALADGRRAQELVRTSLAQLIEKNEYVPFADIEIHSPRCLLRISQGARAFPLAVRSPPEGGARGCVLVMPVTVAPGASVSRFVSLGLSESPDISVGGYAASLRGEQIEIRVAGQTVIVLDEAVVRTKGGREAQILGESHAVTCDKQTGEDSASLNLLSRLSGAAFARRVIELKRSGVVLSIAAALGLRDGKHMSYRILLPRSLFRDNTEILTAHGLRELPAFDENADWGESVKDIMTIRTPFLGGWLTLRCLYSDSEEGTWSLVGMKDRPECVALARVLDSEVRRLRTTITVDYQGAADEAETP